MRQMQRSPRGHLGSRCTGPAEFARIDSQGFLEPNGSAQGDVWRTESMPDSIDNKEKAEFLKN